MTGSVQDIALSGVIGALSYALDITEGQPAGPRGPLLHDRDADRRGAAAPVPHALGPLLRAAAQGRGLLGQRRSGWRRCSAPTTRRQAHVEARRLDEPAPGARAGRCAPSRPGGVAARPRRAAARASRTRATSRASSWRRAATAAPRSRACSTCPRRPPPRSAASTSTGTGAACPTACAARRSRCSRGSSASRRRVEIFHAAGGVTGRAHGRAAPARALVRPGAGRRAAARSAATARSGRRSTRPDVSGWEPADLLLRADDDAARPDRRGVRARDRREVAVHRAPLRARRRDRRRRSARVLGFDAGRRSATCAAPGCCTTSASSRSPT